MKPINYKNNADSHIEATGPSQQNEVQQESCFVQQEGGIADHTPIDKLQSAVCAEGSRLLSVLDEKSLLDAKNDNDFEKARAALVELGKFSFNIGFAGEQSSGKSTVINSLLHYPLMPTCQTKTTAVVVQLAYSDHLRIRVRDEDSKKIVLDYDCHMPKDAAGQKIFRERFGKLLDYGVSAMRELVMETFQPFSDLDVLNAFPTVSDMDMSSENPRHVMILLFVLLAVYVGQNDESWDDQTEKLMNKRKGIFRSLGIPADTMNISIFAQANFEILKSGLVITDLPGLGSSAGSRIINGRKVMGHDEITISAIKDTDAMVFLSTPENRDAGYQVLTEMLSNAKIKEAVYKSDRIIAVLNKADCLGEAQRVTTLRSFCTALAAVGVKKELEDILCYSGIAGEFRFEDTPFERTLYYKENFDENALRTKAARRGRDFEDLKEEKLEDMKDEADAWYQSSNIEKLSCLFRTTYVEQGKYIKSTSALQTVRIMVKRKVSELQKTAENCELLSKNHESLQESMVDNIQNAVEVPISDAIMQFSKLRKRISQDVTEGVAEYADNVPTLYISAFEDGLDNYKEDLKKCMEDFDTRFLGLGNKARIDEPGSKNRKTYLTLQEKINSLPVSLTKVNRQYEKMLNMVRTKIDRFYEDAQQHLTKLEEEISRSLDAVIREAKRGNFTDKEIETLVLLKDQMLSFVGKQVEIVQEQCRQQQDSATDAMRNVVDAVLDLNRVMTSQFATATQSELKKRLSTGGFFTTKDYILIDGSNGLKTAVNELHLREDEKEIMRINLDSEVNSVIRDKIPNWIDDLNEITTIFQKLQEQLLKPMKDLTDSMGQSADDNAKKAEALWEKIQQWQSVVSEINQTICPALKEASILVNDREPVNINMQDDIFFGCFDRGGVIK